MPVGGLPCAPCSSQHLWQVCTGQMGTVGHRATWGTLRTPLPSERLGQQVQEGQGAGLGEVVLVFWAGAGTRITLVTDTDTQFEEGRCLARDPPVNGHCIETMSAALKTVAAKLPQCHR